jgi:aminoglycoside phosphotransferase (APT) family kinase protein
VKPPSRAILREVLGGDVLRVTELKGGISCSVHAVRIQRPDGTRENVVVRRYGADWQAEAPEVAQREFNVLQVLARRGFPAPRPLLLDKTGVLFGMPTVVISRLPGRGVLTPRDLDGYLQQMVDVLVELHQQPVADFEFLPSDRERTERMITRGPAYDDPLQNQIWAVVRSMWPKVRQADRMALIHGDFWPGNVVWLRDRLTGVVDWEMTRLGDPSKDVGMCRCDVAMLFDMDTADEFSRRYALARGGPVADVDFWSLYATTSALRYMHEWAAGYQALGRTDLTPEMSIKRVEHYAQQLLGVRPKSS